MPYREPLRAAQEDTVETLHSRLAGVASLIAHHAIDRVLNTLRQHTTPQ